MVVGGIKGEDDGNKRELATELCDLTDGKFSCTDQESILNDYTAPPLLFKVEKDFEQTLYDASCLPKN